MDVLYPFAISSMKYDHIRLRLIRFQHISFSYHGFVISYSLHAAYFSNIMVYVNSIAYYKTPTTLVLKAYGRDQGLWEKLATNLLASEYCHKNLLEDRINVYIRKIYF